MLTIHTKNLSKVYTKFQSGEGIGSILKNFFHREYKTTTAVNSVSFQIESGNCVGLLGANGAGKTTLIKMLSGLLVPSSGEAEVAGFNPWERDYGFLRQIGVVMGQKQQMWIDVSAFENLRMNQVVYEIPYAVFKERVNDLAEKLGVSSLLHTQIRKLSLGEKMKMELLASFLHRPKILFLDEPTIGLDLIAQSAIRQFIRDQVQKEGVTVLLTSHYMKDLEELCSRVLLIQNGKLMHDGPLTGLLGELQQKRRIVWVPKNTQVSLSLPHVKVLPDGRYCLETEMSDVPQRLARLLEEIKDFEDLTVESPPIEEALKSVL